MNLNITCFESARKINANFLKSIVFFNNKLHICNLNLLKNIKHEKNQKHFSSLNFNFEM